MDAEMDRWWGKDEDVYLDEDGKPISKEDYFKQFLKEPAQEEPLPYDPNNPMMYMVGGMINPFDKDGNLLPQFQTREPMEDDSMFQGRERNQLDDWVENERRTTNPFYHLQGGDDDYDWQGLAGRLGPILEDSVHDMFLSPEEIEKKRLKKEACKLCHEGEEEVGGASPFYHLRGSGKLDEMTVRQLIDYGKSLGVKGLDGKTKDVIIAKIEAGPKGAKVVKTMVPPSADGIPKLPEGLSETEYKELIADVYKLYIAESLVNLQAMAKDFKITNIPHKTKETLARELAKKHVDAELDEILNPPHKYSMSYTASEMRAEREQQAKQAKAERARLKTQRRAVEAPKKKALEALRYALDQMEGKPTPRDMRTQAEVDRLYPPPPPYTGPRIRVNPDPVFTFQGKDWRPTGKGKEPVLPPQDALESKKDNPVVEEIIEEPMDDGDIRAYFPNAKIMRYSSLAKMSDIEQLLPRDKTYAFLLYEDSPGSGHWVVVLRYGTTIEFFCSYGSKIDGPLKWYNPKDNAMLGQSKPYLSMLLKKADKKFKAIHNAVPFQSSKHGVATCGAWDVMRVNQLVNHNQDLHEFQSYMEDVKKETGLTYDEIVANYVSKR